NPVREQHPTRSYLRLRAPDPKHSRHDALVHREALLEDAEIAFNFCVFDSSWEASEEFRLEQSPKVEAWVKNDHLAFEILYLFNGVVRKYRPDFLIRLANGVTLVLEV